MKILIGKTAGFCYGVKRAVEETKKELDNLQASNLSCKVDISKLTKEGGVVSPTVDINNENNVLVDSQNPQTVDVTFTKAEE